MQLDPRFRWFKLEGLEPSGKLVPYYFRGITARELRASATKKDRFAAEHYILSCTVLGDVDWDLVPAGTVHNLLSHIYRVSGLTEESETFAIAADWIKSDNGVLEAAAVSMISGLTLEMLDNCCPTNYAKYLLMGKYQFENMYGVSVEQAFGLAPVEQNNGVATSRQEETVLQVDQLGREVSKQRSEVFEWRKGQAIEIDPEFINNPIKVTYTETQETKTNTPPPELDSNAPKGVRNS